MIIASGCIDIVIVIVLQRYAPIKIIGIKIIRSIKSEKSAVTGLGPYKLQVKIS
jgi:hypothetical protein